MVMGSTLWEEARDYCIGKQKKRKQKKKQLQQQQQASTTTTTTTTTTATAAATATVTGSVESNNRPEEQFVGPDTSSLTAFFLSFISTSEPRRPGHDQNDDEDDEKTTVDDSDAEEEDDESTVSSSGRKLMPIRDDSEQQEKSFMGEPGGLENIGKEELPSTVATTVVSTSASGSASTSASTVVVDDLDAEDWQLVSEKDLMTARVFSTDPPLIQVVEGKSEVSPTAVKLVQQQVPPQLPEMSEQSSLLTQNLRSVICQNLPTLVRGRQWVLLYSTMRHGISLRTLYRKSNLISGPSLLVAGDRLGAIFGGLISSPLKPTPKKKYQGTSESFVFTNVAGTPKVFRSTGCNRYFVLCTNDSLSFGGGGHFALHIDSELLYGSSAECETFGNSGLASTEDFVLKDVELWGFAHTSRYVPKHASYTEPEYVPGIYTW